MGTVSPTIMEKSASKEPSSPIAPRVPIMIVPVNAAENNTVASSSPPESMNFLPRLAPSPASPVVNTSHIPKSVVEESTERTIKSTQAPVFNTPIPETVIHGSASAEAEVKLEAPVEKFHNNFPVLSETAMSPVNVEAEPVSTSSVTPKVAEVSASNILLDQSTADPEPVVAAAVVERKMAETTATPTIPNQFRKKATVASSVKDLQEFSSNSPTSDNSPSSSRFNSLSKKRTSIIEKFKNIFHRDKEKEKK